MKKVFLDNLPRRNGKTNQINWSKCLNLHVEFIYDDIKGDVEIIDFYRKGKTSRILIKYLDKKPFDVSTDKFKECKIGEMLGLINHKYTYKIGEKIKDEKRNIVITKLIRIKEYKAYEYRCLTCGYVGKNTESHIIGKRGCPVCINKKVIKGINDIASTHPNLVKYFANKEDAYTNSFGSDNEVWFKCPDCGFEKKMKIQVFKKVGFSCSRCGDGITIPNKIGFGLLEYLGLDFKTEYSPNWCKYLFKGRFRQGKYDFYFKLNNKKYILEMDGGFHKKDNKMNGQTKEESQYIDNEKDRLAQEHGIEVIRIDCNISEFNYIKQNILNNANLNNLFDLNLVVWDEILQYTLTNKMKESCDLYNNGMCTKDIAKLFKMATGTIVKYLNSGKHLNLCDYNGEKDKIKASAKEVKCIEHNLIFPSATKCASELSKILKVKLNVQGISMACIGKRKSYYKMHFEYI